MHFADITMFYANESGGVRRYLNAKHRWLLSQTSHRHSLLTPGKRAAQGGPGQYLIPSPPLPFSHGYRFPVRRKPWTQKLLSLEPDLIEAGDPYVTAWAALNAGQELGVPTVAFYHSDLPRALTNRFGKTGEVVGNRYIKSLYKEFDLVLAPSMTMVQRLDALGITSVKLQPLGVDSDLFHPARRNSQGLRRQLGIPADSRLVIFAGRYSHEKNIPLLLDVMKKLGRYYHLLLVGPDMPESRLPNIHTLNLFVDQLALADLLASSDVLIHAGAEETFGLIVLEAMAAGLPVVGVDAGGVGELIDNSTGVRAEPGNPDSLAEAVTTLFASDCHAKGRAARGVVEQKWSWDTSFQTLLRTYGQLTGNNPLPQPTVAYAAK